MEPGAELPIARLGLRVPEPDPVRAAAAAYEDRAQGTPRAGAGGRAERRRGADLPRERAAPPAGPRGPAEQWPRACRGAAGTRARQDGVASRWTQTPEQPRDDGHGDELAAPTPGIRVRARCGCACATRSCRTSRRRRSSRLVATADFGNGVSAELPFEEYLFINADLTIHLWRPPRGEWIGLDAQTLLHSGGTGVAESVLHDEHGPVGRAFQTLVVQPR